MSLVAAAVVPAAPALLPGVGGSADPLADVRAVAVEAVARAVAVDPAARIVVVSGAVHHEGGRGRRPVRRTWPGVAPSGAARYSTGRVLPGALPAGLEIGRELVGGRWEATLVSVAEDAAAVECARLGADLVAERPVVLVVVADGSATRTVKAPGHLDQRAEGFDARLAEALESVDGEALLAVDPVLAEELWCRGRAALQVLGGAAEGSILAGEILLDAAPFGVGYLVATWLPRS